MAPMDKITGVSLPCLMSDHDRWKSQSTTVSATDETWQILPADVKAAVKAKTSLGLMKPVTLKPSFETPLM